MRLLNVSTFDVEEFFRPHIPPHAILSHTWGAEEITLAEMEVIAHHRLLRQSLTGPSEGQLPIKSFSPHKLELKAGFSKIALACGQASGDHFQYIWIDTCCIDKTSSAELSEAINSMFSWYQSADICYAYLPDVEPGGYRGGGYRAWEDDFAESRWFKRGWTLQELLAPHQVVFHGKGWVPLGTKVSLARNVEKATGIDRRTILDPDLVHVASIARRMSWAAHRSTTRVEDTAYCLMGIFGVNMPLLYGEGQNAFLRLQEEIIKRSSDQTILAWGTTGQVDRQQSPPARHAGLPAQATDLDDGALSETMPALARSPKDFAGMGSVIRTRTIQTNAVDYRITNMGLHIELPLMPVREASMDMAAQYLAALDCRLAGQPARARLGILLTETHRGSNVFVRTLEQGDTRVSRERLEQAKLQPLYIANSLDRVMDDQTVEERLLVKAGDLVTAGYDLVHILPLGSPSQWNRQFWDLRLTGLAAVGAEAHRREREVGCLLGVLVFFSKHLDTGFLAQIVVDRQSRTCFVGLETLPPQPEPSGLFQGGGQESLSQLNSRAEWLWKHPGRTAYKVAEKRWGYEVDVTKRVELVTQEGLLLMEEDFGDDSEHAMEPRCEVLFPEKWEREYHRVVKAEISREEKGIILLEISSMLFVRS